VVVVASIPQTWSYELTFCKYVFDLMFMANKFKISMEGGKVHLTSKATKEFYMQQFDYTSCHLTIMPRPSNPSQGLIIVLVQIVLECMPLLGWFLVVGLWKIILVGTYKRTLVSSSWSFLEFCPNHFSNVKNEFIHSLFSFYILWNVVPCTICFGNG
jgi:hypothetical protein